MGMRSINKNPKFNKLDSYIIMEIIVLPPFLPYLIIKIKIEFVTHYS
jgi:hypothetical protein